MLVDDNEQQQPTASFHHTRIILTNALKPKDESSEIIANMTKTLHMNTPEQTINGFDFDDDDDDDDNNGNNGNKQQQLIEQLQGQLIHNLMRRTQARDYTRILQQSNTPAYWYRAPPTNRSVYFYDPNYQKHVQQRTTSIQRIKPNIRSNPPQPLQIQEPLLNQSNILQNNSFSFTPRTKYMLNLYNTAVNYRQQKQRMKLNYYSITPNISQQDPSIPSRLQSIPTLPPINTSKQRNELSNTNGKEKVSNNSD